MAATDVKRLSFYALLVIIVGLSAELTARAEDFLRRGVPFVSTPDRTHDLVVHDALGIHGRPNGRYGRWQLNSAGFRGPEIARRPLADCHRIIVLGASESFGLYESDGHDYPSQLGGQLRGSSCYEVVNASLFGLTLPAITRVWESWVQQFGAQTVIIYPTPAFYLNERPPTTPGAPPKTSTVPPWWTSRLMGRAFDLIEYPEPIHRRLMARQAAKLEAAHDPGWFFEAVPADRVALFEKDLETLVSAVVSAGASPVLVTHATGFQRPPAANQLEALELWRLLMGKPRAHVLLEFEEQARQATIRVAGRYGVGVVDAAGFMNGREELFADDRLHFNDAGAAALAAALASHLISSTESESPYSP